MSAPWGAGRGPEACGERMHALATELFPITRSLTGPGYRRTLEILEQTSGPMERHRFASGEAVLDWFVPREWTVRDAWLRDPSGRTVVSLADSNLHLVSYSAPVHRRLGLDELQAHLHSLPEQPDAIPYRTSYYAETWGFCITDRQRRELPAGEYEAYVDADLGDGHLEVGEVTTEGRSSAEVLFSTYCCHPSMANNELSGPVVVAHLARRLAERRPRPRYTYRFLFLPETIGAIAYLARFGERLLRRLAAGYVVTCVGDRGDFTYKRSRRGDSLADRAAEHVLRHGEHPFSVVDFFPTGSDERQYCSPGYDLPVGSLMRSPYGTYPEYHTSLDDLSFITPETLGQSLETYERIVEALESGETLASTVPYGEPQLGRRGLYPSTGGALHAEQRLKDTLQVLNLCDGTRDLLAVADRADRPIEELRPIADLLAEHGLLRLVGGADGDPPAG